jgi:protein arginine N-methyltransferase 5
MDSESVAPSFCIGQHESKRTIPITSEMVQLAHESNVSTTSLRWLESDH